MLDHNTFLERIKSIKYNQSAVMDKSESFRPHGPNIHIKMNDSLWLRLEAEFSVSELLRLAVIPVGEIVENNTKQLSIFYSGYDTGVDVNLDDGIAIHHFQNPVVRMDGIPFATRIENIKRFVGGMLGIMADIVHGNYYDDVVHFQGQAPSHMTTALERLFEGYFSGARSTSVEQLWSGQHLEVQDYELYLHQACDDRALILDLLRKSRLLAPKHSLISNDSGVL